MKANSFLKSIGLQTIAWTLVAPLIVFAGAPENKPVVSQGPSSAPAGKILKAHLPQESVTLDWTSSAHEDDKPMILNLQEGLVVLSRDLSPVAAIASSWSYDKSGTHIRFQLNRSKFWSDGRPVFAKDFVAACERLLSPGEKNTLAYLLSEVVNAEEYSKGKLTDFSKVGVAAPSDFVFEVTLKAPNPKWVRNAAAPALFPIRSEIVEGKGNLWLLPGNLVSNGPFKLISHTNEVGFTLTRNPHYIQNTNVSELDLEVSTFEKAVERIKKGELHVIFRLPKVFHAAVAGVKALQVVENPPNRTRKIDFNLQRYPTSQRDFRFAIASAISRAQIRKEVVPYAVPASTFVPPVMEGYRKDAGVAFDPKLAKSFFARSFPQSTDKAKIEILVPNFDSDKDEHIKIANYLKTALEAALPLQVELVIASTPSQYFVLRDSGAYHLLTRDFNLETPDPLAFYDAYGSGSRFGVKWSDSRYDKLIQAVRSAQGTGARKSALAKIDDFLLKDEVVLVPLFYKGDLTVYRNEVTGMKPNLWEPYFLGGVRMK